MRADQLLPLVKLVPSQVDLLVAVGSRVYGTAREGSDHDHLLVRAGKGEANDLYRGEQINITLVSRGWFDEAVARHNMLALEALFAPAPHRLLERPALPRFRLDRKALRASVRERALGDLDKARRRFDEDPARGRKRLFHALRVATFGAQVARHGRLVDLTAATPLFGEIEACEEEPWPVLEGRFAKLLEGLLAEL